MDGIEATKRIRAIEKKLGHAPIPILSLTADIQKVKDRSSLSLFFCF